MPELNTQEILGDAYVYPVAANTTVCAGEIACINADGYLVAGSKTTGLKAVGIAQETATAVAAGSATCLVRRGTFKLENLSSDAVDLADIGSNCYIHDSGTVCATETETPSHSVAGKVRGIIDGKVAVRFD